MKRLLIILTLLIAAPASAQIVTPFRIRANGTLFPKQTVLNFQGSGIVCTNNVPSARTDCDFKGLSLISPNTFNRVFVDDTQSVVQAGPTGTPAAKLLVFPGGDIEGRGTRGFFGTLTGLRLDWTATATDMFSPDGNSNVYLDNNGLQVVTSTFLSLRTTNTYTQLKAPGLYGQLYLDDAGSGVTLQNGSGGNPDKGHVVIGATGGINIDTEAQTRLTFDSAVMVEVDSTAVNLTSQDGTSARVQAGNGTGPILYASGVARWLVQPSQVYANAVPIVDQRDGGGTSTTVIGLQTKNDANATNGNQEWSPSLYLRGSAFVSTPANSQQAGWMFQTQTIQGTTQPSADLSIGLSLNDAAPTERLHLTAAGLMTIPSLKLTTGTTALDFTNSGPVINASGVSNGGITIQKEGVRAFRTAGVGETAGQLWGATDESLLQLVSGNSALRYIDSGNNNAVGISPGIIAFTTTGVERGRWTTLTLRPTGDVLQDLGEDGQRWKTAWTRETIVGDTVANRPACTSTIRGAVFVERSASTVGDIVQACLKGTADTFTWQNVFTAP